MRAVGADRVFGSQGHCRIAYLSAGLPTLRGFAPGLAADDRGRMTRAGGRGPGHGRATHRQRYRHRDARVDRRLRQPPGGAQRQHNRPRRGSRPDDPQAVGSVPDAVLARHPTRRRQSHGLAPPSPSSCHHPRTADDLNHSVEGIAAPDIAAGRHVPAGAFKPTSIAPPHGHHDVHIVRPTDLVECPGRMAEDEAA
jgi:hypothetical protein